MNRILIENMLRFGPKSLDNSNKANLRRLLEAISTLPKEIYWTSCDGQDNLLTTDNRKMLTIVNAASSIVKFTQEPIEKAVNPEYSIQSCVVGEDTIIGKELKIQMFGDKYYLTYDS